MGKLATQASGSSSVTGRPLPLVPITALSDTVPSGKSVRRHVAPSKPESQLASLVSGSLLWHAYEPVIVPGRIRICPGDHSRVADSVNIGIAGARHYDGCEDSFAQYEPLRAGQVIASARARRTI